MTPTNDKVDQSGALPPLPEMSCLGGDYDFGDAVEGYTSEQMIEYAQAALQAQTAQAVVEASRPDILEKLTYHRHERDDMTLEDCLEYLANRWKKIHGRTERAMIMQITELLAATPQQAVAASSEPVPDQEEDAYVINRLSTILADVAIALKGDELPLHRHSYHDLADGVRTLKLEVELHRMQEAERQASTNQPVQAKALTDDLYILSMNEEAMEEAIERFKGSSTGEALKVVFAAQKSLRALLVSQPSAKSKAMTADRIVEIWKECNTTAAKEFFNTVRPDGVTGKDSVPVRFAYALLSEVQADVAAVRDAALEEAAVFCKQVEHSAQIYREKYERDGDKIWSKYWTGQADGAAACARVFNAALKSAAPTAQPQADGEKP